MQRLHKYKTLVLVASLFICSVSCSSQNLDEALYTKTVRRLIETDIQNKAVDAYSLSKHYIVYEYKALEEQGINSVIFQKSTKNWDLLNAIEASLVKEYREKLKSEQKQQSQ